ncbi:MAG: 23S rRNA (uracil(1939)-C(5))-methyltransferase RlmD [Planctomycetota bacterium]
MSRTESDDVLHCRHFGTCGGCSLLDQPIRWQLHDKREAVERLLAPHLGGLRVAHDEPRRTPRWFRTRLLYPVRADDDGLPIVGLYAFRSNDLVRIEECQTVDRWLVAFGRGAEQVLRELQLVPFDARRNRGHVKAIWARLASGSGEVMAGIVTRPGAFTAGRDFAERLAAMAAAIEHGKTPRRLVGIVHSVSDRDDDFLLGDRHTPLRGRDHVVDRRDGLAFRISAGSFYQIHAGAYDLLYRRALQLVGDVRGRTVVDGFGGIGCFGLRLAHAGAAQVTIVEENATACRDAEHNAQANGLAGVTVVAAAFAKARFPDQPDLMVVDPPRSGLGEAGAARVIAAGPRRLLHVACEAEALARDLPRLLAAGFRVRAIHLCDLFPHTEHVELLTLLER